MANLVKATCVEKSVNKRIAWSDVLMLAMLVIVKYRMQPNMKPLQFCQGFIFCTFHTIVQLKV